ncbi:related to DNA polymerase Tdt-N [Cephalotrichum gorgonifer]|uniref:DNA polymerase n=1 Tax=Cephalotrichum gorgonifer TaxID=2041049 RepID=A0AAE8MSL9_9PEZI|nr:related to DNA polymerase Tdt-N [Cephalotrichum gorgonifer]
MTSHLQFPPIYLLPVHLEADKLHSLEEQIPTLTYDPSEADVIVGNVHKPERALFELRRRDISFRAPESDERIDRTSGVKRRKISETRSREQSRVLKVAKLKWFTDSVEQGHVLPLDDYLVIEVEQRAEGNHPPRTAQGQIISIPAAPTTPERPTTGRYRYRRGAGTSPKLPPLLRRTTSEEASIPPVPEFLSTPYSCQRPTPVDPPNSSFVDELKKIRKARILAGDAVGVRAYSSSIASVAAYPHLLRSQHEVAGLPGCGRKIAELYKEWKETGKTEEAGQIDRDPRLATISLFYDIWGVGDVTAREFYNKGWRDLDDVVEYGWSHLTRVQQIGVKYYDDLKVRIPRKEVEYIADTILDHARKIDPGFEMAIVGSYRRGRPSSGDVDVIISHRDEALTHFLVGKLVVMLEEGGFVTHTLTLSTKNSEREQETLPWKGGQSASGGGFDTLDKALLMWRTPEGLGPNSEVTSPGGEQARLHRRVDIIVSPWKTVGCAIIGWTGGTTFERDLRRYCKAEKGFKFDSSGIRNRVDGSWVDLEEGALGKSPDMNVSERRVFAGLGLEWRPPEERCTG